MSCRRDTGAVCSASVEMARVCVTCSPSCPGMVVVCSRQTLGAGFVGQPCGWGRSRTNETQGPKKIMNAKLPALGADFREDDGGYHHHYRRRPESPGRGDSHSSDVSALCMASPAYKGPRVRVLTRCGFCAASPGSSQTRKTRMAPEHERQIIRMLVRGIRAGGGRKIVTSGA
ncbi:hypothetical protein FQR65_LT20587 [Abscondita terminalis]|nr:hypothetical protein FQR65_LT20587 [Abscondita terminalis]